MCACACQVNLRYGVKHGMSRTGIEKDTCTACAGSMLLEFSALSRLTGNTVFEVCLLHASLLVIVVIKLYFSVLMQFS